MLSPIPVIIPVSNCDVHKNSNPSRRLVREAGVEPTTFGSGGEYDGLPMCHKSFLANRIPDFSSWDSPFVLAPVLVGG
jgi:hypothetical protein